MPFKEFFYKPKSDRNVFVAVLIVFIVSIVLIYYVGGASDATTATSQNSINRQKGPISSYHKYQYGHKYYNVDGQKAELFPFDPNTADSTRLLRLGLRPWQVRNIYNYRAKGGIYHKPSDFARLYGLTRKQYLAMEPYIRISDDYRPASEMFEKHDEMVRNERDTVMYPHKIQTFERISLNAADTGVLKKVPNIGSYFARQIVNYRNRLGGFYSLQQLLEIEDFPEESLKYMSIPDGDIKKINLNQLTLNQLKRHPYINFYMAREIVDYRRLKGPLHSLNDLCLLKDFSADVIKRLEPYVEF